jgi:predicted aldo/keto reductase-like oxidoreductase
MQEGKKRATRREFIKTSTAVTASLALPSCSEHQSVPQSHVDKTSDRIGSDHINPDMPQDPHALFSQGLPRRMLGRTGLEISMLAFGGGSQFMNNADGDWEKLVERALELGINYFDTASSYSGSEARLAALASVSPKVYIATKFDGKKDNLRNVDVMMQEFETSLRLLHRDYVDVLLIHEVNNNDDVRQIEQGVYARMQKLKEEKAVRFIGFSSMNSATRSKELITHLDFDVVLMAMNPTLYGDYATVALPVAKQKQMGVLAMKVMRDVIGVAATADELIHYALDRDSVSAAVIGHHGLQTLEENAKIVSRYTPSLVNDRYGELEARARTLAGPHALSWARAGYVDACNQA